MGAAVGGLLLAFSTAFWGYALVAEVFPLNSFFGALLLLLLEWERRPERAGLVWAFALGCGLAATNHHTIVLLGPAFLVLLWSGVRRLLPRAGAWKSGRVGEGACPALPLFRSPARVLAVAAGLLVVGLVPYLYLPLAAGQDPPLNWNDPSSLGSFVRLVSRADYGTFSLAGQAQQGSRLEHLGLLAVYLFHAFTPLGCLLTAPGGWWLARNRPLPGLALLLAFLVSGPLFLAYANPSIEIPSAPFLKVWKGILERFYILPSLPFALAAGVGAFQVLAWVRSLRAGVRYAAPLASLAVLAIPAGSAIAHFGGADQRTNLVAHHFGEDLLAPIEPGGLFITRGDAVTFSVEYLQMVEQYRPDVTAISLVKLRYPWYVQEQRRRHPDLVIPFEAYDPTRPDALKALIEANLPAHPVYLAGEAREPELRAAIDVQRAGFSARLVRKGTGPDQWAVLREKIDLFEQLHYPTRSYPDTTWEFGISRDYGSVAYTVAALLDDDGRAGEAAALYRTAIRLMPDYLPSYKRLGLLLLRQRSAPSEAAAVLEQYLRLNPGDPEAAAIRGQLDQLRGR